MDENIKLQLTSLISGLYFMSESEYPFTIEEVNEMDINQIEMHILSNYNPDATISRFETKAFFEKIIHNLECSGEELSQSFAKKYKDLYEFIIKSSISSTVLKCGKIEVGVYIVLELKTRAYVLLKTISIET
jgi:AICAR transformylase/IMP cyclohydrolase PurH